MCLCSKQSSFNIHPLKSTWQPSWAWYHPYQRWHDRLVRHIWTVRYGENAPESDKHQHAAMLAMVEKWSSKLDFHPPASLNRLMPRSVSHIIVRSNLVDTSPSHTYIHPDPYWRYWRFGRSYPSTTRILTISVESNLSFARKIPRRISLSRARVFATSPTLSVGWWPKKDSFICCGSHWRETRVDRDWICTHSVPGICSHTCLYFCIWYLLT